MTRPMVSGDVMSCNGFDGEEDIRILFRESADVAYPWLFVAPDISFNGHGWSDEAVRRWFGLNHGNETWLIRDGQVLPAVGAR